jgi:sigma-54 specific flagellar transcriptional regulator A
LSERAYDLPLLVFDLGVRLARRGLQAPVLSDDAMIALGEHSWPGNVRELANLVERLSIVTAGRVADIGDLPAKYRPTDWSSSWIAPQFASEIASLDTTLAERILLDGDVLPEGTQLLPTTQVLVEFDTDEELADKAARGADSLAVLPEEGIDLRAHLTEIERKLVVQALARSQGVVAHAARLLGLRRTTLVEKLRKLDLLNGEDLATED